MLKTKFIQQLKVQSIKTMLTVREILLSQSCLLCKQPSSYELALCENCNSLIKPPSPIPHQYLHNRPWKTIRLLTDYQSPIKELIHDCKFHNKSIYFYLLGELFAQSLQHQLIDPELLLIPVPLHPNKLLKRGFNQALEIAKPIAKTLNLKLAHQLVRRQQEGKIQHRLNKQNRKLNAEDLFSISTSVPKKVAIVDDIFTTGATMGSICNSLQKAGAEHIEVWIIARTLKHT